MAQFSFDGNPMMSDELFAQMMQDDKGIREAHYNNGYCDRFHRFVSYYVNYPSSRDVHDITPAQKAQADARFAERKAEQLQIAQETGTLTFVTMGVDYSSQTPGGIGNHRVRTYFTDKKGHKWFVELMPVYSSVPDDSVGFRADWTDETFEEEEIARYSREYDALVEKYGSRENTPHRELIAIRIPAQRHGHYAVNDHPYTLDGVRKWLNRTFKCNYRRTHIERHFLSQDDYVSHCL